MKVNGQLYSSMEELPEPIVEGAARRWYCPIIGLFLISEISNWD
jgi:hypothetical protein